MKFYLGVYLLLNALLVIQVSCQCGIARVDQTSTQPGRFPWHVLIYQRKSFGFYDQICAGTLISSTVVISAAHCFYNDDERTKLDASSFIVVAGKRFLDYNQPEDSIQRSGVQTIDLPTKYYGSVGKYMNDIAWLILQNPFDITTPSVGVICMDFESEYESEELRPGQVGKAVGRGDSSGVDSSSNEVQETNVPFVSYRDCISKIRRDSDVSLLYDKFCGGYVDGSSICSRDAGGGLVFYHNGRWYLRGIIGVSIGFQGDCSTSDPILFTNIRRYIEETKTNIAVKVVEVPSSSEANDKPVTQTPSPPEGNFECGVSTVPSVDLLIANGFDAGIGGFPWHTGIYRKNATGYFEQICAGSLVSENVVISAAHCFYDDRLKRKMNANLFAIAVGKHYRPYNWLERFVQKSPIETIHLSRRYLGTDGLYAGDIAYVILEKRIILTAFVKPVCLEINSQKKTEELLIGQVGKAAGWGLTADGSESHTLQQMNVPFVPYRECVSKLPQDYKPYVTIDKFCAGYLNGTMLCSGDSGGGLVYQQNGRWYLRGIVSVNPRGGIKCERNFYTAFTDVGLFGDELSKYVTVTYN